MNKPNIKRVLDWRGSVSFGVVLIVALALSWWSLYSLAVTFYGVPQILAIGVSAAFDGAALFVADLASKYARTEDSGLATKLATYLFVGASVYLNVEHAILLSYGVPGMVLFGAPPVIAGILFELYLRFIHRSEMRAMGLVPKRMPVFGKISWLIFPGKTFRGFKNVVFFRLNEVVTGVTGQPIERTKSGDKVTPKKDKKDKRDKTSDMSQDKTFSVTTPDVPVTDTVTKPVPVTKSVTGQGDKSVSALVRELWSQGVTDRTELHKQICDIKGTDVPVNTVNKAVSRLDNVPGA
ncbi:membrane protein [Streptomyces phage Bmoc]|uniref:Membrane protein n=1 Tax=Streptomyces phage Bmoc TaxID=2725629 RepID=A0A6M3SZZ4_9CAUD|nr:membrane protein [Streptomyces phage Bmoc]QJD50780.1 membrane protein [Streptomyces phage Bmoc]